MPDFTEYINEPNPERWRGFPELMWELGFEMDCYKSVVHDYTPLNWSTYSEKQIQDHLLWHMAGWSTQQVGNYIFSRYRELTHWSDYGYPKERGHYFFKCAFPILQQRLMEEWETRNTLPSYEEFVRLVIDRLPSKVSYEMRDKILEFASTDEALFYLRIKYDEYIKQLESDKINIPQLRGCCVSKGTDYLIEMY